MANLAVVGSHRVNGVSELHTRILKESLFKDFDEYYPDKFINITNGISPRRWLIQANPALTDLVTSKIGDSWMKDLERLRELTPLFIRYGVDAVFNGHDELYEHSAVAGSEILPDGGEAAAAHAGEPPHADGPLRVEVQPLPVRHPGEVGIR